MKEITVLKQPKPIRVKINPDLNQYDNVVMSPRKLEEANEALAKYGLPKEWQADYDKIICEKSFWVRGWLSEVNIETCTCVVFGKASGERSEKAYNITAFSADILLELVKKYEDKMLKVHIKPKGEDSDESGYEFIEALPINKMIVITE